MTSTPVYIYTDGSCSGNPGPGGWGVVLTWRKHSKTLYGSDPETTNNAMELTAIIRGLQALKRKCQVKVYSDSKYVILGASMWMRGWRVWGWKTTRHGPLKNKELWMELYVLTQKHSVSFTWIKSHNNHPENELADRLAKKGTFEATKKRLLPLT